MGLRIGLKIKFREAQATAETAIFGTLLIFVLGVLISYGQSLNQQHSLKMEAFRKALRKAYETNAAVSYAILRHKRNADIQAPFAKGRRNEVNASSSVMWCRGVCENRGYYEVDGREIELPRIEKEVENDEGNKSDVKVPVEIYKIESSSWEDYNSTFTKEEGTQDITTTKTASVSDIVVTRLYGRFNWRKSNDDPDSYEYNPSWSWEVRSQYNKERQRTWRTPHQ